MIDEGTFHFPSHFQRLENGMTPLVVSRKTTSAPSNDLTCWK